MIKPGGGANWILSKANSIDTYTIKTGYDKAIIEIKNTVFPADGNIEDLVLLGEYGGKPGSAAQYVQITAKEAAGSNKIDYASYHILSIDCFLFSNSIFFLIVLEVIL